MAEKMVIETTDVLRFVDAVVSRTGDLKYLAGRDLQQIGEEMLVLSGQSRAPRWEKWLLEHSDYTRRVASKEDRGDFTKDEKIFDELKTAVLLDKEIKKGILCTGNQVRLWQKLNNYIFITTNRDTMQTRVWKIEAKLLKSLYKQGKVRFSSGHIAGQSVDKMAKLMADEKVEWTFTLHEDDYNWNQFEITNQF